MTSCTTVLVQSHAGAVCYGLSDSGAVCSHLTSHHSVLQQVQQDEDSRRHSHQAARLLHASYTPLTRLLHASDRCSNRKTVADRATRPSCRSPPPLSEI
jgi:hypothetical protein